MVQWRKNAQKFYKRCVRYDTKFGQILSIRFSRYWAETKFLSKSWAVTPSKLRVKMTGNNPKLDLANADAHTKFGDILWIYYQDIELKLNSDFNQGLQLYQKFTKNNRWQSQARSCQCWCAYKIWSDSVNLFSRYWAETKFWHKSRIITLSKLCQKWQVTIPI